MATKPDCTINGCRKATRKGYTELDFKFRAKPRFIATIDFGTTHCSVAYLNRPDLAPKPSEVDPILLSLDEQGNKRVPSCILFDMNGERVAFGYEAREHFTTLKSKRVEHYYFEHVKRLLQQEKNIHRNTTIHAMNGKPFFVVDIIAHILHHLKCRLLTEVRGFVQSELKASDIDWVITVPAIWKSRGKKMMREAGYMAGLCSDSEPPPPICIATGSKGPPQEDESPEKLSLALEPESAAIHCQHKAKVAGKGAENTLKPTSYIIVDIGGGTVDIASHTIVGDTIEEIAIPDGNDWGGTTVNEEFSKFLQDFVDDPKFSRYIEDSSPEIQARHKADLNKLLYTTFEAQKKRFGSRDTQVTCNTSYAVQLPRSFYRKYEDSLVEKGKELNDQGDMSVEVEEDDEALIICNSRMSEFFKPAIDNITELIESYLKSKIASTIDTIYWVGGFGGCKYLRSQLEMAIKATFQGCTYHFPVPPEPEFAVIRGATAFRCDPGVVTKRKADATYGTDVRIRFDPAIHRPNYKVWDEERQEFKCENLFSAFVEKGEDVCTNEVFVTEFLPSTSDQKRMSFTVYSAPRKDVWYISDNDVYKLGKVTIDLEGSGLDREAELVCDITHTEIQIRARDKTSGNERKAVVDFLSSSK